MPHVDQFGIAAAVPNGWHVAIRRRPLDGAVAQGRGPVAAAAGERPRPVLHASTRAIPPGCGDFGGGAVELLSTEDIFVALIEYGADVADQGLFARQGLPRLAPSQFAQNRLPRFLPPRSASQQWFSAGGRAFCLYTIVGDHARRMALVPKAMQVVRGLRITDAKTMRRKGGLP